MDLADFLLARIAEDEAPTWALLPYECEPGCCAPEGWVGSQCRYCDPAPVYGGTIEAITRIAEEHAEAIHQRSRVLARCAADRRIVNAESRWRQAKANVSAETLKAPDGWVTVTWWDETGRPHEETVTQPEFAERFTEPSPPSETLKLLAVPYADHPDYREAWKP